MQNKERTIKRKTIIIAGAGVTIAVLLALYFAMAFYFNNRFIFRTQINGRNVGGMTAAQAEEKIAERTKNYVLTITCRDGEKYYIYGQDIEYSYADDETVEMLLKEQNPFLWVVSVFKLKEEETELPVEYDEELLAEAVSSMDCLNEDNIIEPRNAEIVIADDEYYIESEVMGTQIIYENMLDKIEKALEEGLSFVILTDDDYENPQYTGESAEVTDAMATIEKYIGAVITYEVMGEKETIDTGQMLKFIYVDEDYRVIFDDDEIAQYVQSLADKYNTYADVRSFKTSSGDTIEIGGGDYGWVVDKDGEAEQIKADMETGEPTTRELVYSQHAFVEGADDIGDTYIEIDYTNQHIWFYKDGELITDSDIVSGNISLGNGSPDGIFKIVYKQSPAVLKGEDYESDVTYFMPFAYNVGIHDASWRNGNFGGEIYKTGGSHGCINVPEKIAKKIYKNVEVGTPVIAYYRESVELTAENCKISNAYSYTEPEE